MADFFDKEEEKKEEPEKIKVGEKEYTQEELNNLVNLGQTAQEYETKWNRKIGEFYPDYTQKSQRLSELEKKEAERARIADQQLKKEEAENQKELEERAAAGKLTPEEIKVRAIEEARALGLMTREEFDKEVRQEIANYRSGEQLVEDTQIAISEASEKYGVKTTVNDVLKHMEENGFRKPEKALKDMFEPQIDKWKEEQLRKLRPEGMFTQEGSTAGAKEPPPRKPITRDKLSEAIRNSLMRSRGA